MTRPSDRAIAQAIQHVRDQYPEDVFPDNGTFTGKSARMARLTCDNIEREIRERLAELDATAAPKTELERAAELMELQPDADGISWAIVRRHGAYAVTSFSTAAPVVVGEDCKAEALLSLIGNYWDLGYKEGKEGRLTDTEDGAAQWTWSEIERRVRSLTAALAGD